MYDDKIRKGPLDLGAQVGSGGFQHCDAVFQKWCEIELM